MTTQLATDLNETYAAYRAEHPKTRIRDVANALGASEAELLATGVSAEAVRLDADWGRLLTELEPLGPLMALTRNDAAVHEKTGVYRNVQLHETHRMGQVLAKDIDLRLFLGRWKYGFAVALEKGNGHVLRGLQFFDKHGTAAHKIYLREQSDEAAYEAMVERHHSDAPAPLDVAPPAPPAPETPDEEVDVEGFLEGWRALTDTHGFFPLVRRYGVTRAQALRLGFDEFTRQVALHSHRQILKQAAESEIPIMVFVRSPGTVQIHTGPVERLKASGNWFNVLDPGFNLHLNESLIDRAWVVQKPTEDGRVTSLELYDASGRALVKLFGERKPGRPEREDWRALADALPAR